MPETVPGQRADAAERRRQVVAMRRRRFTFEVIGQQLGVSRARAYTLYREALAKIPAADLDEHRAEELTLIDDAIRNLMATALDRNNLGASIAAWNAIRGWCERKAKLLGLDAPARARIEVITEDVVDAEIARLAEEIGQGESTRPVDGSGG